MPLPPRPALRGERVGVRGSLHKAVPAAPQRSTSPISTKCTARNPCPSAPTRPNHANPISAAAAKSSSRRTHGSQARSSARRQGQAAARRGIGVGGRRGSGFHSRHCERSEAIHVSRHSELMDCFVALLLAMTRDQRSGLSQRSTSAGNHFIATSPRPAPSHASPVASIPPTARTKAKAFPQATGCSSIPGTPHRGGPE